VNAVQRAVQPIVVNPGFAHQVLASGLSDTTAMTVAPDGRVFVAQKNGVVRVIKNGALLATPLLSLTVNQTGERGLLGIALDPDFASNGRVYLNYATTTNPHMRISRFNAVGDVAALNTEVILVDGMPAFTSGIHVAGAIHFGNDGKIYMAHGDNEVPSRAQDLNHPYGKLLRFNADGSIPTDNPFYNTSTGIARAVWAYGLRNPYTFAVQKSTGKIYVNDVSLDGPEEIYDVQPGANYGWGGTDPGPAPVHSYPLDAGRCAITGGVFYESAATNFPSSFQGKYFFSDYCAGQIWFMNADGTGVTSFADDSNGELVQPVDLDIGADGSLYYLQRGSGAKVGRIYNPVPSCSTDAQCSNDDVCDGVERCVNNICEGGTPLSCDDGNQCTTNSCDPASGCSFPDNGTCCVTAADCNDGNSCTADACVSGLCQNTNNGSCNPCVKLRSQRTNNYLVLNGTNQVLPTGTQAQAQIFEKIPSGPGFKFKNRTASTYARVVSNVLTVDTTDASATVFNEHDCSSGGAYPGGKGYSSPTGTAPHWKATTETGAIMSGSGGNATSCAAGSATSWERFYPEAVI
jgi:glucose/arabinose dehydrogenase